MAKVELSMDSPVTYFTGETWTVNIRKTRSYASCIPAYYALGSGLKKMWVDDNKTRKRKEKSEKGAEISQVVRVVHLQSHTYSFTSSYLEIRLPLLMSGTNCRGILAQVNLLINRSSKRLTVKFPCPGGPILIDKVLVCLFHHCLQNYCARG